MCFYSTGAGMARALSSDLQCACYTCAGLAAVHSMVAAADCGPLLLFQLTVLLFLVFVSHGAVRAFFSTGVAS